MEELDTSDSSSFEQMPTESGSVGKKDRCALPVRNLVLDGTGSSYVVRTVLSYISSNSEKNEGEPCDGVFLERMVPQCLILSGLRR